MYRRIFILVFSLLLSVSSVYCSEILFPAAQIEKGKACVNLAYTNSSKDICLNIEDISEIDVNGITYSSESTAEIECNGKSDTVALKFIINPQEKLYYWLKLGAGKYDLEIPSVTVKNKLSSTSNGWIAGIGLRTWLFPDTIVSPAIAVDFGVNYNVFDLDSFRYGGVGAAEKISNKLSLTEVQLTCLTSKKYSDFEPYGGLKVFRTYSTLKDESNLSEVSGTKDNVGLFLGAKLNIYNNTGIIVEASMIGETSFSVGWNEKF